MYTTVFRMRLQISHFLKSFLKLKQIFNLIKMTKNVQMYLLQEIAFNFYKINIINLYNVSQVHKLRKRAFIIKKSFQKIFKSKIELCCSRKI